MIRTRLPANLQPELQRCLQELGGIQTWLQKLHQEVMHRFDRLERQPKSPYWISIDDQARCGLVVVGERQALEHIQVLQHFGFSEEYCRRIEALLTPKGES